MNGSGVEKARILSSELSHIPHEGGRIMYARDKEVKEMDLVRNYSILSSLCNQVRVLIFTLWEP